MDRQHFEQARDDERGAMAAICYIGMALALVVCVAAAALVADYWTDLAWARDVLAAVAGSLR